MIKTTVYLPEAVKRRISRIARQRGVSEATLIREGVERIVSESAPRPRAGLFHSGDPTLSDPRRIDDELRRGFGLR